MKHAGNIDFARALDRQLDQVSAGTVLLSLAALSMAVAAYLLG